MVCFERLMRSVVFTSVLLIAVGAAQADRMADFVSYFEIAQSPAGGAAWFDPTNALSDNGAGVSLGGWTDSPFGPPTSLTGGFNTSQGNPVGLVVGFNAPVTNNGNGVMDLLIQGNPIVDNTTGNESWWEPGYIEVARETTNPTATPNGWADETFYLIKPGNYDQLPHDPRTAPINITYTWAGDDVSGSGAADSYTDPIWQLNGTNDLYGYADIHAEGDRVDISDAIDINGNAITLSDISYVRIRTVSDTVTSHFGSFSTEVMYVAAIPEPATIGLMVIGGIAIRRRR